MERLMYKALRRSFRRVCWVGPLPEFPRDRPLVLYVNHHNFYDGYLLWLLITRVLHRHPMTWMRDWDQFPLFAPLGALPFPAGDPGRRVATVRETAARMKVDPLTTLFYFPEGELHPPDEGLLAFDTAVFAKLDRIFPNVLWWPVAIHVTWWGESLPTALLGGGPAHPHPTGGEQERLEQAWDALRRTPRSDHLTLLEGRTSPHEHWNFSRFRRFFSRYV